jgi:hypothetical protein
MGRTFRPPEKLAGRWRKGNFIFCALREILLGERMKDEVSGSCNTHVGNEKHIKILQQETTKKRDHLRDLDMQQGYHIVTCPGLRDEY